MSDPVPAPATRRKALPVPWWAWVAGGALAAALVAGLAVVGTGTVANVPGVVGLSAADAASRLAAAGFAQGTVTKVETSAPSGRVLAQSPAAGAIGRHGDRVSLTVATPLLALVPDVTGRPADEARTVLAALGLAGVALESYDASATSGTVTAQAPPAGTRLVRGASVGMLVSRGPSPAPVTVPDVAHKPQLDAVAVLTLAGFTPEVVDGAGSSEPSGTAAGQVPRAGARAPRGSIVYVLVSRGPSPDATGVPEVADLSEADAVAQLSSAGFPAKTVMSRSTSVATGTVITQLPAAGSKALKGSQVLLVISAGRAASVPVPPIAGLTAAAAQAALAPSGLGMRTVSSPSASVPAETVVAQLPAMGATADIGSAVLAIVSSGEPK